MSEPFPNLLHVLYLEDNLFDRELVARALADDGLRCEFLYAKDQEDFKAGLRQSNLELILSDFTLPSFDGLAALELAQHLVPEVPFLFISGTIGEQRAVASLKLGATDYVLKDHLDQLAPAVRRALREAGLRRARQEAEEQLRIAHDKLRHLLAHTPAVIYTLKIEGSKLFPAFVSDNVEHLLGVPAQETMSYDWWLGSLHPDDRERVVSVVTRGLAESAYSVEYRIRHKDGTYRWVEDNSRVVRDAAGEPREAVGVWTNITERKKLEEQLRQAQKMEAIGQLAGGVAHDFNNLLAVMSGNAELVLLEPESLSPQAGDCLKQIATAAQRAANLTRQLLAFSRKQVIQPQPLVISEVIADLAKMLKRIIGENINLKCELHKGLPYIQADPGMIEQVLINLVINARDAMPQGGCIQVATDFTTIEPKHVQANAEARGGEFVRLTVQDNGAGIDPEHLPRIFEPFFTTKEVGKGTGLGLAMVYGIVKQHQGWIEVVSQPRAGTRFDLFFPAIARPSPSDLWRAAEGPLRGGTETILLVEDDSAVRMISRRVLENYGYHILEAGSGPEALQVWHSHKGKIDLLLTDMVMPQGLTGRDLSDQIRARQPNIKTIFMSGYSAEIAGKNTEFIRRTNSYFLQKPCSSQALLECVRRSLDGR